MPVDFSKMTQEIYEDVQLLRKRINNAKKQLTLLSIDLNNEEDFLTDKKEIDKLYKMKEVVNQSIEEINKADEELKEYEI
jgi:hypothetical protein